jgi:excisionase family DNA binding protein
VSRNTNPTEVPATAAPQRLAYTIKEAADVCSVSPFTIHTAIAEGRLPARRLGKPWVILHSDLVHFLNDLDPVEPSTKWLEKRKKAAAASTFFGF